MYCKYVPWMQGPEQHTFFYGLADDLIEDDRSYNISSGSLSVKGLKSPQTALAFEFLKGPFRRFQASGWWWRGGTFLASPSASFLLALDEITTFE